MDKVIPFRVGNGDRDDPTADALEALGAQLEALAKEIHESKPRKPAPNGRARDLILALVTAAMFALFAFLWTAHSDIEVIKARQEIYHPTGG